MKARRPEKFSDSILVTEAKLNRNLLEYHLNSITSRNGERLFETFAVKLAQVEISPNLRMQTGPVGGGDSKADSETYPVSDLTQLSFYEGIPNVNNDRWAFAISAKKTWTTKVVSDVEGIHSTGRDYKRIFFITNQFAKDKKRAELEDTLSKKFNIELTILDLSWILDRVFTNNRVKLAVEELQLGDGLDEVIRMGQLDIARSRELDEINNLIESALSKKEINLRILRKSLKAAILTRELERPRTIIEGTFERSIRITTQFGTREQLFHVKYQLAWTAYFWFEDFELFLKLYEEVEELALDSHNIFVAERLNNLWQVLSVMSADLYPVASGVIEIKSQNLKIFLTKFVTNESSPSAGLQARVLLIINELFNAAEGSEKVTEIFEEIRGLFKEADMLIGFPYESILESVQELGNLFPDNRSYEKLLNELIDIDIKRKGDVPAAVSYMAYGIKQYKIGQYYKAINYLGKSLAKLFKEESKDEFVNALYWLGKAYEKAGLLWAARGAWINAASFATSDYWKYDNINWMQSLCYSKLKFIELRLGRVTQSLEWHQLHYIISKQLAKTEDEQKEVFREAYKHYGMILACLLIKTQVDELPHLEKLADILFSMDLDFAAYAILYLLGGRSYLPKEFTDESDEDLLETFSKWQDQPAQNSLPHYPLFYINTEVRIKSKILGGEFEIITDKNSPAIEIAETFIAAFESFLSTAMNVKAVARIPKIIIKLVLIEKQEKLISFNHSIDPTGNIIVNYCKFSPHKLNKEQNEILSNALLEITGFVVANAILFPGEGDSFRNLFDDREVYDRSFSFARSMVTIGNVLGYDYKQSIYDWFDDKLKSYPFIADDKRILRKPNVKQDDTISSFKHKDFVSHNALTLYTVINERVWAQAHWRGVSYMGENSMSSTSPPAMVLMFANEKNGKQIFQLWKDEFGEKVGEHVRIAIIKGIDKKNPFWYSVSIGPFKQPNVASERFVVMTRLHIMNAESHKNLDQFISSFTRAKGFWFAPGFSAPNSYSVDPFMDLGVWCTEIVVKDAWEIGSNDLDSCAITPGSEPVIPASHSSDAPVLETLKIILNRS
jgi:tetratricopeptide (TPR) repeat protein